jgi:hypothetical protein
VRRNGSIIAHGREWPLYERWKDGVMVLRMSPEDQIEKYELDEEALRDYRRYHCRGAYE